MLLFSFLISFISSIYFCLSYIVIPFDIFVERYDSNLVEESKYNITRLLNEWFSLKLFTKLKLGNQSQEITTYINPQDSCFQLSTISFNLSKLSNFFDDKENHINLSLFNINSSDSFKNVSNSYSSKYDSMNYFIGNDEIYLYNNFNFNSSKNIIKSKDLNFLVYKNNYFGDCAKIKCGFHIGMPIFDTENKCPNFNKELKRAKLTNKYIFSIHYFSKKLGAIIFGAYPHEYLPSFYKEEQLSTFYTRADGEYFEIRNFNMIADEIISVNHKGGEVLVSNNTKVIFEFYYGFIIGTSLYQNYIETNFFNDLIEKKICLKSNRTAYGLFMAFDLYSCNEEYLNEIKRFPELKFYLKNTKTSFVFNFNELFLKIGNQFYFMVIFDKYSRNFWEVGFPFFKKYDIVFDEDNKIISYYNANKNIENNENKNNVFKIILIIFLGIIAFCGLLVIGFYLGKSKYIQRKKRANELDDDEYDYKEGDKIINNNEIKRNNKAIISE